jgi:hypothetical protein
VSGYGVVLNRYQRGANAEFSRGSGGVLRGYWVLKGVLGIVQSLPKGHTLLWEYSKGYSRGYSVKYHAILRALERHSSGCSEGVLEGVLGGVLRGVLGGHAGDTRRVRRGLGRLWGTLDHSRVYTHARARAAAFSALVVTKETPSSST